MMSPNTNELFTALSKAQSTFKGAVKDSQNPFFKSKYADLESVWEAVRESLTKNGLCLIQSTEMSEGVTGVVTILGHSSGQWIKGFYPVKPVKDDPQALGAATTYARRYAMASMLGVHQVDDDAESAMNRPRPPQTSGYYAVHQGQNVVNQNAVANQPARVNTQGQQSPTTPKESFFD